MGRDKLKVDHVTTTVMAWPAYRNAAENPYNKLLSEALSVHGVVTVEFGLKSSLLTRYDVLHIHWPDALLKNVSNARRSCRLLGLALTLFWIRVFRRKPIVWTVHNVRPHGSDVPDFFSSLLATLLGAVVDHQIHLNSGTASKLAEISGRPISKVPFTLVPHGRYSGEFEAHYSKAEARSKLGLPLDAVILGFVGTIASYKGAYDFCRVIGKLPPDGVVHGVIAGHCREEGLRSQIEAIDGECSVLHARFGWLSADDLAAFAVACDLIVLPYRKIENSGSVFVPLELNTPVLVPETPAMVELQSNVGKGWVRTFSQPFGIDSLNSNLNFDTTGMPDLSRYSWEVVGERTMEVYATVLQRKIGSGDRK